MTDFNERTEESADLWEPAPDDLAYRVCRENITDLQLGYNFNEGSLKGLSLLFQVNNLTNAAYQTYAGTKDRPLEYTKWGRTYLLGANYKF